MIFFFKQKTAYEMRISDWSSDVCSSDLAGDHRLVQRRVAVGDGGVDLDHLVATIMGVDRYAGFARPAQVEGLAIRGSPVSLPKPGGDRLGVDGVGQTGERRPKGFLAHVQCLHAHDRQSTRLNFSYKRAPRMPS